MFLRIYRIIISKEVLQKMLLGPVVYPLCSLVFKLANNFSIDTRTVRKQNTLLVVQLYQIS
jgi:hypothetical protein